MFSSFSSISFSFSSPFFSFVITCDPNKWSVGGNGGGGGKLKLLGGGCGGGTYRSAPRNGDGGSGDGGGGWKNEDGGGDGGGDKSFLPLPLSFNLFSLFCMTKSSLGVPGAFFINSLVVSFFPSD